MLYYDLNVNRANIVKNGVLKKMYLSFKDKMAEIEVDTTLKGKLLTQKQKSSLKVYESINKKLKNTTVVKVKDDEK